MGTDADSNGLSEAEAQRHREKMRRIKQARDRMLAEKTQRQGLLIVHTGKGKGKTTAALGMVVRMVAHSKRVLVVQFIKGAWHPGERLFFEKWHPQVQFRAMGEGFTWETQDKGRDIAAAEAAWVLAREGIQQGTWDMVVLDELHVVLRYGYLALAPVLEVLTSRPAGLHVVVTGRNAPPALIEQADLVTEMTEIRHPFRAGIQAQEGIEW